MQIPRTQPPSFKRSAVTREAVRQIRRTIHLEKTMQHTAKPSRPPLNGVDTPNLLATINFVAGQPEMAKFQFRAHNEWVEGTHSKSVMLGFHGAGQEQKHAKAY